MPVSRSEVSFRAFDPSRELRHRRKRDVVIVRGKWSGISFTAHEPISLRPGFLSRQYGIPSRPRRDRRLQHYLPRPGATFVYQSHRRCANCPRAARSASSNSTCTSFSASANVPGETSGPVEGDVPNAGGAPGGSSADLCACFWHAAAAPSSPTDVALKNCLRDFDMVSPNHIVAAGRYSKPKNMYTTLKGLAAFILIFTGFLGAQPIPPTHVDDFTGQPRLVVISDIGNEPDDQMSLVRLLMYSNELDIEALIASTSTWQKTTLHPETMRTLVHAYGQVRSNLMLHAKGWPTAEELDSRIYSGQLGYGLAATGPGQSSEGAQAIIRAADRSDDRPLWITIWGGANTLAQALLQIRASRPADDVNKLIQKLRVYSISDQDDAGPWIRREFPNLFYIVEPSSPNSDEYYYATWTGISGDVYYRNGDGASFTTVTNEWLDANIRSKGPLGKVYPRFAFIMEGDTPSFLGLIDNGLNAYRRPDWGGWGGRYIYRQPYGETHAIWTQGGGEFSRVTSQDTVIGADGRQHVSDQATIWRWRQAFQDDFAARMEWTVADYSHANHNPVIEVNGQRGTAPIVIDTEVGKPVMLDASQSSDPDGQALQYRWFHYGEAGVTGASLADVTIAGADTSKAIVTPTATCRPQWLPRGRGCPDAGAAHIILAVTDNGVPRLTSYRRIILNVRAAAR